MPGTTAADVGRRRDGRLRLRFDGWIAGIGTSSGTRVVLGYWVRSPFGPFSDVMLERKGGHRVLLAPSAQTARFVAGTYLFDEVRVVPVGVEVGRGEWTVAASPLDLRFVTGRRGPMGLLLRAVPGPLAARPAWAVMTAPAASALLGVRTHGSARAGRYEWYGAKDLRPVIEARAAYEGEDLGSLAPVEPAVRFGFGSTPRRPCVVGVTTTVALEGSRQAVPAR
ncbi:hypothetical protein ACFYZJ_06660 [Streptomyces sp. NPDC001848]|uniref:hypothetical protein n=1 Tax=Streptomyces sp. NPDC001848 TaxID=3364618 RepID=UPI0036B6CD14